MQMKWLIMPAFILIVSSYLLYLFDGISDYIQNQPAEKVIKNISGAWKIDFKDQLEYAGYQIDDSHFQTIHLPKWEKSDFVYREQMKGWYWVRKTFVLDKPLPKESVSLFLGKVKDHYELYLNGVQVAQGSSRMDINIPIPNQLFCDGSEGELLSYCQGNRNVLALRIYSEVNLFPGLAHLAPYGVSLSLQKHNSKEFFNYYIKKNFIHGINFTLTLTFSLLMFFAYFISQYRANYFLYFSLYLVFSMPMIIYNFRIFDEIMSVESMTRLGLISLGITPFLFLLFFMDFFNFSEKTIKRVVGVTILGFAISLIQSINLSFDKVTELKSASDLLSTYSYLGTVVYSSIFFIGAFRCYRGVSVDSSLGKALFKAFILLLIPFVLGKGIENVFLDILSSGLPNWVFLHLRQFSQGYVLFFVPLMIGLIGVRYSTEQSRSQRLAENRVKILELLEGSEKSIPYEVLFKSVLESICEIVAANRASIALVDADGKARVKAFFGINDVSAYGEEVGKSGQIRDILRRRENVFIQDLRQDPYNLPVNSGRYDTGSAMIFHLKVVGKHFGYLFISDKRLNPAFTKHDFDLVQVILPSITAYLENRELYNNLNQQYDGVVTAFGEAIHSKSQYTKFHSVGVSTALQYLAARMDIPVTRELNTAALLHDLGKVFIDDYILEKPGRLNKQELVEVQSHPMYSRQILETIPGFENIAHWASMHHENYDGTGYPYGLKGEQIPIEAQLINAADIIDALATNRSYRQRLSFEEIQEIITKMDGKFNPKVRDAMIDLLSDEEFKKVYDMKGLDFKSQSNESEVRLTYVNDRLKSMYKSLNSALDLVAGQIDHKNIEGRTRNEVMYNIEKFNETYEAFISELSNSIAGEVKSFSNGDIAEKEKKVG